MAKYEIMLIVSGSLDEKNADKVASDIVASLKKTKVETTKYGSKQLAYPIKKDTHGYYFQYNFETDEVPLINEFRRLCLINKNVLRHLIINLEKDYGFKAAHNEKKIKAAENKARIYAERKKMFEKQKEARMAEMNNVVVSNNESSHGSEEKVVAKKSTKEKSSTTKTKDSSTKTTTKKIKTAASVEKKTTTKKEKK